jgi:Zn-dependent protease with chaperone function
MHAYGLYTQIRANRWRSVFLMIVLPLILFFSFSGLAYSAWLMKRIWSIPYTPPENAEGVEYKNVPAIELPSGKDVVLKVPNRQKFFRDSLRKVFSWDERNQKALRTVSLWVGLGVLFWICIALLIEDTLLSLEVGRYAIHRADEPKLWNTLEKLCMTRGIPIPKLNILETSACNAFSFGYSQETYGITLTRGLVEALNEKEIEAVLAHELTHIRNGDVMIMMIATLIVGIFVWLAERIVMVQESRHLFNPMNTERLRAIFFVPLFFPLYLLIFIGKISSLFIRGMLSHERDYLADLGSVELTHNPESLISALRKIKNNSDIPEATSGIMTICIADPRKRSLFDVHPPIESRIVALQNCGVNFLEDNAFLH